LVSFLDGVLVGRHKKLLTLQTAYQAKGLCQAIPDYRRWNKALGLWTCRPSVANIEYIRAIFRTAEWSPEALALEAEAMEVRKSGDRLRDQRLHLDTVEDPEVVDYKWDGVFPPWAHQKKAFLLSRDEAVFALLMEQRTGKTKVIIDTAAWLFLHGSIDTLVVICPNSVKDVWEEEISVHLPPSIPRTVRVWDAKTGKKERTELEAWKRLPDAKSLKVLVVNVEAMSTKRAQEWVLDYVNYNRALLAVDESTRIKTPGAKRTRAIKKLGEQSSYKRILTGTPVTKSPLDLFSQFGFLDTNILGYGSFYAFRNAFCIMGGYENKEVLAYTNLDTLKELIAPYTFRITAAECQDLPPKVYQRIEVDLSPEQRRLYNELADDMKTEYDGHSVSVTLALTQMTRLQQIVGGFLAVASDDFKTGKHVRSKDRYVPVGIEGKNPKLDGLIDTLPDLSGKIIIWARFRPELNAIAERLRKEYGDESVAEFHGAIDRRVRTENRRRFEDPDTDARFFVSNPAVGSMGLDLSVAGVTIYYSNSFDLEHRLQSEKRVDASGKEGKSLYLDIVARNTVDEKIRTAMIDKKNIADLITGDTWTSWI